MSRRFIKTALAVSQWALLLEGALLLGYCAFAYLDARRFHTLQEQQLVSGPPPPLPGIATEPRRPLLAGDLIGRISVPRLSIDVMVVEGTEMRTLRRAAGHIAGTALPGETGNVGISAHRDTFFRPLRKIQRDDVVTVETEAGSYRYRVVSTRVVNPKDTFVLDDDGTEALTLVTCYPFYFVGPAPQRFVVRAERLRDL